MFVIVFRKSGNKNNTIVLINFKPEKKYLTCCVEKHIISAGKA